MITTIVAISLTTMAALLIVSLVFIVYLPSYKRKVATLDFETLIGTLMVIIRTELDLYDKDIFNKRNAITNANYENFYNDLCDRIIGNISPVLMEQLQIYITFDAIISYVARSVKSYLNTKVNTPM